MEKIEGDRSVKGIGENIGADNTSKFIAFEKGAENNCNNCLKRDNRKHTDKNTDAHAMGNAFRGSFFSNK